MFRRWYKLAESNVKVRIGTRMTKYQSCLSGQLIQIMIMNYYNTAPKIDHFWCNYILYSGCWCRQKNTSATNKNALIRKNTMHTRSPGIQNNNTQNNTSITLQRKLIQQKCFFYFVFSSQGIRKFRTQFITKRSDTFTCYLVLTL